MQRAVHTLFKMPLTGAAFAGCCFTLPGRGETEWLQVRTPEMILSHPPELSSLLKKHVSFRSDAGLDTKARWKS